MLSYLQANGRSENMEDIYVIGCLTFSFIAAVGLIYLAHKGR